MPGFGHRVGNKRGIGGTAQLSHYGIWRVAGRGWRSPPAKRAAGIAAQLPSPGVKGREDGAALESCVPVVDGGTVKGRDQPHPGHPPPDTRGPVPGCNLGKLSVGNEHPLAGNGQPCRAPLGAGEAGGSTRMLETPSGKAHGTRRGVPGELAGFGVRVCFSGLCLRARLGCQEALGAGMASSWGQERGKGGLRLGPVLPSHWPL